MNQDDEILSHLPEWVKILKECFEEYINKQSDSNNCKRSFFDEIVKSNYPHN